LSTHYTSCLPVVTEATCAVKLVLVGGFSCPGTNTLGSLGRGPKEEQEALDRYGGRVEALRFKGMITTDSGITRNTAGRPCCVQGAPLPAWLDGQGGQALGQGATGVTRITCWSVCGSCVYPM